MLLADPTLLQATANADPEFRLAARYWTATLSLESPTGALRVEIADGQVERCADEVKGATFRAMPGLGHFPMCEDPARFRAYLVPVLDEIRARG